MPACAVASSHAWNATLTSPAFQPRWSSTKPNGVVDLRRLDARSALERQVGRDQHLRLSFATELDLAARRRRQGGHAAPFGRRFRGLLGRRLLGRLFRRRLLRGRLGRRLVRGRLLLAAAPGRRESERGHEQRENALTIPAFSPRSSSVVAHLSRRIARPHVRSGTASRASSAAFLPSNGALFPLSARMSNPSEAVALVSPRRSGETGRRAGLKIRWGFAPCGFDPRLRHRHVARPPLRSRESDDVATRRS